MAESPSHKFGQIIGDLLEEAMVKYLTPFASMHSLFLDYKHPRLTRQNKKEVIWEDINGNSHKLDIVFEKNGTNEELGLPQAFIEIAWRRYKKHSKNKAQEIQGAILPLISKYHKLSPFYGAVIAGEFTKPSIVQLESVGFKVVYFKYNNIAQAFNTVGIELRWEEDTSEANLLKKISQYEKLSPRDKEKIIDYLIASNADQLDEFVSRLNDSILRKIESIGVFSLHGNYKVLSSVKEAYDYIARYNEDDTHAPLVKYEITIRYNNGDKIDAQFKEKQSALIFLMEYS